MAPGPGPQAVYGVLKEAEHRSTFYIPYWNLPLAKFLGERSRPGGQLVLQDGSSTPPQPAGLKNGRPLSS